MSDLLLAEGHCVSRKRLDQYSWRATDGPIYIVVACIPSLLYTGYSLALLDAPQFDVMSSSIHFSRGVMAAVFTTLISLSTAQLTTSCNPMNGSQFPCPANTGLCKTTAHVTDYTSGDDSNWVVADGTNLKYTSDGAEFTIAERYQAPTVETDFYIFYGRVSVVMKSSPGQGIVSSVTLASDVLDEIDWVIWPALAK